MSSETRKHPLWKQVVDEIVEKFNYGQIIHHEWLYNHLEIPLNKIQMVDEYKKASLEYMSAIINIKQALLEDYQMMLVPFRREGLMIVEPEQQPEIAWKDVKKNIKKHTHRCKDRLLNTNTDLISIETKQELNEKIAKLSMIMTFAQKKLDETPQINHNED